MKKIVFILMLLPLFSNAQKKEDSNKDSDGILKLVHADKTISVQAAKKENRKNPKNDTKYSGSVQFKIGNNQMTCDSAIVFENDDLVTAYNVTISNPEYFTTKGGTLEYNKETKRGNVLQNVTVTALNGSVIGTSESVEVDFKKEAYRIGMGSIRPVEQAK
jgi:lipopolysaccharide assembly outer membrane protein LptD (OstA)